MEQNGYWYVSKSEFWAYFLNSRNAKKTLEKDVPVTERAQIFNEYVAVVNIETSSYCNRSCVYCPVAYRGSRSQNLMSSELFEKIVGELKAIDYRGIFTLSLFNEPLADKDILQRAAYVRQECPCSYIRFNSNGDYLDKDFLSELSLAGVNEILITQHMNQGETYTDELAAKKIDKFFKRIEMEYDVTKAVHGHNITCDMRWNQMRLLVVTNNWETDGNDRGGEVKHLSLEQRTNPCATPFREMIIDVEGNVRFCWNAYIDTEYIANVADEKLVDIYFSDEMVEIRREHLSWGKKSGICRGCNTEDNSDIRTKEQRDRLKGN